MLVIEDEPLISMLLESMLEDAGYDVVATASSLKAGLAAAAQDQMDVAILDMTLGPDVSFGIADVLERRGIPFIFASGHDMHSLPQQHAGRQVLSKPFTLGDLERTLGTIAPR